jgi:hypothetical protein
MPLTDEPQRNHGVTFREYYRQQFRTDVERFMMSIPAKSRNHDYDKSVFTIQFKRLTKDTLHLNVVAPEHRPHFSIALFLSVLVDQVCYTHFRQQYDQFRVLTLYPKFIGNCPGGCHYHFHPSDIFAAINFSQNGRCNARRPDVVVYNLFDEASDVMKGEVFDFFTNHMKTINPVNFWEKCVCEFPYPTTHDKESANKAIKVIGNPGLSFMAEVKIAISKVLLLMMIVN